MNVDFVTKVIEIGVNDHEPDALAAQAAISSAARAKESSEIALSYQNSAAHSADTVNTVATALTNIYNDAIKEGTIQAPAVDSNLSIPGAAADAKITGYNVSRLMDKTSNLFDASDITNDWELENTVLTVIDDDVIKVETQSSEGDRSYACKHLDVRGITNLSVFMAYLPTGSIDVRIGTSPNEHSSYIAVLNKYGVVVDVSEYDDIYIYFMISTTPVAAGTYRLFSHIVVTESSTVVTDYTPAKIYEPYAKDIMARTTEANNICPFKVNKGMPYTNNGLTLEAISENVLKVYGTASGFSVFFLVDGIRIANTVADVPYYTHLKAGTYTFKFSASHAILGWRLVIHSKGVVLSQGVELWNGRTITLDTDAALTFEVAKNTVIGTIEDPFILTLNVRKEAETFELESDYKISCIDLKARKEIKELSQADINVVTQALSDSILKNKYTNTKFINNVTDNISRTPSAIIGELQKGVSAVITRHDAKRTSIRFAFITDTHKGGSRTPSNDPSYNIDAFISQANEYCDFAISGGDIITNYQNQTYMPDLNAAKMALGAAAGDFGDLIIPFLPAKGNHDIGLNGYTPVSTPSSYVASTYYVYDSETGTFYSVKSQEEFDIYVAQGRQFYTTGYDLMTNEEYYNLVCADYCQDAIHGETYGAYYYQDFDNLRALVLNDFYVSNSSQGGGNNWGAAQLSFVQDVFDDALAAGKTVISFSHTAAGGTTISSMARAFMSAGGKYVGHIHGHEHSDIYSNNAGINNIGVNWGCSRISDQIKYDGYIFDLFEIDITNERLYEIRFGVWKDMMNNAHGVECPRSEDRIFDYNAHVQII